MSDDNNCLDLKAIEARLGAALAPAFDGERTSIRRWNACKALVREDVPLLLAEIKRLREKSAPTAPRGEVLDVDLAASGTQVNQAARSMLERLDLDMNADLAARRAKKARGVYYDIKEASS